MIIELVGRNCAANGLFDEIEQSCRFFDARTRLGAHVHEDLTGIHGREEILAEERPESEGNHHAGKETGNEQLR